MSIEVQLEVPNRGPGAHMKEAGGFFSEVSPGERLVLPVALSGSWLR
jgi:hypothetical protein